MKKTAKWHEVKHCRFEVLKAILPVWKKSGEVWRSDIADNQDDYLYTNVCVKEFWSGKRSLAARYGAYSSFTRQHRYPRKLAMTMLLDWMTPEVTFDDWEKEITKYLIHDITTGKENQRLRPYQTAGVFTTPEQTYIDARITLVKDPFHKPLHTVN